MAKEPKAIPELDDDDGEPENTPSGILGLPSTYVETTFCNYWTGHVKISFAERIDGKPHYRLSVVMEVNRVKALIRNLQSVLASLEKRDQASELKEKSAADLEKN